MAWQNVRNEPVDCGQFNAVQCASCQDISPCHDIQNMEVRNAGCSGRCYYFRHTLLFSALAAEALGAASTGFMSVNNPADNCNRLRVQQTISIGLWFDSEVNLCFHVLGSYHRCTDAPVKPGLIPAPLDESIVAVQYVS